MVAAYRTNVLIVAHSGTVTGGAEKAAIELALELRTKQIRPFFIIPYRGNFSDYLEHKQIDYRIVEFKWWDKTSSNDVLTSPNDWSVNVEAISSVADYINVNNIQVCVSNTSVSPWGALAARVTGIPHVWLIHEMISKNSETNYVFNKSQILSDIELLSDLVVANSQTTCDYLSQYIAKSKIRVIYPLYALKANKSLKHAKPDPGKKPVTKIVIVGRYTKEKGQFDAVKAVEALRKQSFAVELTIVGDINDSNKKLVMEYLNRKNLGAVVKIVGHKADPGQYVKDADIALNCSNQETLGRTTIEAMLLGIPVIGANNSGTAEIITHGKTGLLYETGNVIALCEAIKKLINTPGLAAELTAAAQKDVQSLVDLSRVQFNGLAEYILTQPKRQPGNPHALSLLASEAAANRQYAQHLYDINCQLQEKTEQLEAKSHTERGTIADLNTSLNDIYASRSWRMAHTFCKIVTTIKQFPRT